LYELRDGDELLGLDGLAAMALRSAVVEAAAAGKAAACAAYVELIRKSKWNVEHRRFASSGCSIALACAESCWTQPLGPTVRASSNRRQSNGPSPRLSPNRKL
jgi:hypothetical protein